MAGELKEIDVKTKWLVISYCYYSSQSPAHSTGLAGSKGLIYEVQQIRLKNLGDASLFWAGHLEQVENMSDFPGIQGAQRCFGVHLPAGM